MRVFKAVYDMATLPNDPTYGYIAPLGVATGGDVQALFSDANLYMVAGGAVANFLFVQLLIGAATISQFNVIPLDAIAGLIIGSTQKQSAPSNGYGSTRRAWLIPEGYSLYLRAIMNHSATPARTIAVTVPYVPMAAGASLEAA